MNIQYPKVPNIITGKDLDYLSDMFNWNYEAYKKSNDCLNKLNDMEMKNIMEKATNTFYDNMITVLNILEEGGTNE